MTGVPKGYPKKTLTTDDLKLIQEVPIEDESSGFDRSLWEAVPEFSDIAVMRPSKTVGVFGPKGSAKSTLAAILAEGSRVREGREVVYTPEEFRFHIGTPLDIMDLLSDSPLLIGKTAVADEYQRLASKYAAASLRNQSQAGVLQQIRKKGCYFIYTSNAPEDIDPSVGPQTNMHIYCQKFTDPRCAHYPFHLKDCRDTLNFTVIDTQREKGFNQNFFDGRTRRKFRIRRLIRFYKLFNTYAAVSAQEMSKMDKTAVMAAYEDRDANMSMDDFLRLMRYVIIPKLVEDGATKIIPQAFSEMLADNRDENGKSAPIIASPERIGRAMIKLGLSRKRGQDAYPLPELETMEQWQMGYV